MMQSLIQSFLFLSSIEITRCESVCKNWKNLARNPVFKKIWFGYHGIVESKAVSLGPGLANCRDCKHIIRQIMREPRTISIDFSKSNISDANMEDVYDGLIMRELEPNALPLKLLDINCPTVSKIGIEKFLKLAQKGKMISAQKIQPTLQDMILKISSEVDFTEELLIEWQYICPSLFASGLRILE